MPNDMRSCSRDPVELVGRLLAPVVRLLDGITGWATRRLGVRDTDRDRISPEELSILVERGGEQGVIEAEEEQMIGAVLGLGERKVHEVMVPRIAIVALPADGHPGHHGRHHRGGRPLAHPGLRGLRGQHRGWLWGTEEYYGQKLWLKPPAACPQ